jgi:two-component system, LuxR family, response regulator FixJ
MNFESVVYLVDDDPGVLKALTRLLRTEAYTVRSFNSANEFLLAHDPLVPGCVVLDMLMPNVDGLALQRTLLASATERFIIFITGHGDIDASVQAMKAGAVDFLTKPFNDEDFLAAVRNAVTQDQQARKVRMELQTIRWRMDRLTPREQEVLRHVVAGRLNKQIAADLGIAEKTIKVHRARAMEKMGAGSLAELVRFTVEAEVGAVAQAAPLDDRGRQAEAMNKLHAVPAPLRHRAA